MDTFIDLCVKITGLITGFIVTTVLFPPFINAFILYINS